MDSWENYSFTHIQKVLIKIHKKLNLLPHEIVFEDCFAVNDRIETLLKYLEKELKRYGMYNQYKVVPKSIRRKQLLYLLTIYLNKPNFGAGDAYSQYSISYRPDFEDQSLNLRDSVKQLASIETENFKNFYIQYQLYSAILRKINLELNGFDETITDPILNVLIIGLCIRLKKNNSNFDTPLEQQRICLLKLLAANLTEKCNKISLLEMINDSSHTNKFTKCEKYPREIWEKVINIGPKPDLMTPVYVNYPLFITELFLELLAEEKENIIMEEEQIFKTKIIILKNEALETIQAIKTHINYLKGVDEFLNNYKNEFKVSYNVTENEFYRQEILKNDINKVILQIKKTTLLTDLVMKEMNREIEERTTQIEDLKKFINKINNQYQQCVKNKVYYVL